MSAPEKTRKPKKLDKGKKGELAKKKKPSSGNLMIILSVVGVVVLLAVGITMFFLLSGGEKPIAAVPPGKGNNQAARDSGKGDGGNADAANTAPDLTDLTNKANDLIEKLADSAKKEEAGKLLKDLLESDAVNKAAGGKTMLLTAIMQKAKAGNEGALQFLKKLATDSSNPSLAQAARKMYDDNLKKENEADLVAGVEAGDEPTSYIPNKADVVFSVKLSKFVESDFHRGVFATGAFDLKDVIRRLGVPADTVEHFIACGMKDFNQAAAVVRTTSPMNWEDVKKTMHLEEAGTTIKGKTYYLGKVDFMTEFLGQRIPGIEALRDKAAFWRVDSRTLVYADETTMKDLLENPPEKDKNPDPPPTSPLPGGDTPPQGNFGGTLAGGVSAGSGGNTGGVSGVGAGGSSPTLGSASGGQAPAGKGGGVAAGGGGAEDSSDKTGKTVQPAKRERFMTIDPKLRRLISLTEDTKQDSLVLFVDKATSKVPVLVNYVQYLDQLPSTKSKEIDALVLVLPAVTGSPSMRLGVACKTRSVVRDVSAEIEKLLTRIGKEDLHDLFGYDFKLTQTRSEENAQPGAGGFGGDGGLNLGGRPPMGPSGGNGGGMSLGRSGGPGVTSGSGGGGAAGGDDVAAGGRSSPGGFGRGNPGNPGGGMGLGRPPAAGGGGMSLGGPGGPGFPGGPPGNQNNQEDVDTGPHGQLTVERSEEYIIVTATVKSSLSEFIDKHLKSWMQQIRGSQEMASGKFRLGDLARSLEDYKNDLVRNNRPFLFPQGAYPRTFDAERGSRPYPASERVSFLRELLPYLADDRYYGMQKEIDPELSWKSPSNLNFARILVPHFLNPAVGPSYSYVKVRGVDTPLAATHFVGMAGVGPDAASLPKSDPRAGIMGYDRQTSPDDVKDGLSNTIFMIEADKSLLGPWLQGGGATVRGTSLAGNDVGRRGGFSSPNYSGKPGVWVLMADGSARYLSKDISPEVFKALCTMAGSDSAGAIDLIASKVSLEVTPRTEAASAISSQRKKRVVEEEEVPVKK